MDDFIPSVDFDTGEVLADVFPGQVLGSSTVITRRAPGQHWVPTSGAATRVTVAGNIIRVRAYGFKSPGVSVKRISKDEYQVIRTGEVKQYVHGEHTGDNLTSFFRQCEQARDIINTNIKNYRQTKFITLTYDCKRLPAEALDASGAMRDLTRLHADFTKFWHKFKRYCSRIGRDDVGYISAAEPQRSGTWHLHILPFWKDGKYAPFIPVDDLANMWGLGFVTIESLAKPGPTGVTGVDNVGAYLTAYVTDLKGKKYERLQFYPAGMRPFRWSRNVLRPAVHDCKYYEVKKYVDLSGKRPTYIKSFDVTTETVRRDGLDLANSGACLSTYSVTTFHYNLLR